ncbi:MAG TPA: universal stress protein, partial [Anaerolineae bacterium]
MFSKILVPLDGSALAENALAPASALARVGQGQIILLRVPESSLLHIPELHVHNIHYPEQAWDHSYNCREYLNTLRFGRRHIAPDVEIQTRVISGDVASVIVDSAVDEDVDLIVMSTHGRSGFNRWVYGSVTEKVLRQAPCPVLVVRSQQPVERVLITLDGSALSERALEPGLAVARAFDARVTLLRVEGAPELVDVQEVAAIDRLEPG